MSQEYVVVVDGKPVGPFSITLRSTLSSSMGSRLGRFQ
jgi:hypothetical protein